MANNSESNPISLSWGNVCSESETPLSIQVREYPGATDLWHLHRDFLECVIVLSGSARNDFGGHSQRIGGGDIQVLPAGVVHRYSGIHTFRHYTLLIREGAMEKFPAGFRCLPNFSSLFATGKVPSQILHLESSELSEIVGLLEEIRSEYFARSSGWVEAVYINFCRALLFVLRHASLTGKSFSSNPSFQIGRTLRYMTENPFRNHTLQSLSAYARMSESSFRHHFRSLTGQTPIDCLIRLRLRRAALLIAHTDHPISVIALQTGFSDSSYFARQFHSCFQMTARKFRAACQAGTVELTKALKRLYFPDYQC